MGEREMEGLTKGKRRKKKKRRALPHVDDVCSFPADVVPFNRIFCLFLCLSSLSLLLLFYQSRIGHSIQSDVSPMGLQCHWKSTMVHADRKGRVLYMFSEQKKKVNVFVRSQLLLFVVGEERVGRGETVDSCSRNSRALLRVFVWPGLITRAKQTLILYSSKIHKWIVYFVRVLWAKHIHCELGREQRWIGSGPLDDCQWQIGSNNE